MWEETLYLSFSMPSQFRRTFFAGTQVECWFDCSRDGAVIETKPLKVNSQSTRGRREVSLEVRER